MKKPTDQQRLRIYVLALISIKTDRQEFSCNAIAHAYGRVMYSREVEFGTEDIIQLFPEFIAQKPKIIWGGDLWFNTKELGAEKVKKLRIEILQNCIKSMSVHINSS